MPARTQKLGPYRQSLVGVLLAAREAATAPLRPKLRETGVTEQQWRVLRVLDNERTIDPTGLAESALLFAPSVTRILKELVDRGLIVRESDEQDRRRSILSLSPAGETVVDDMTQHIRETLDHYNEAFGQERLHNLVMELQALTAAISPEAE